MSDRVSCRAEVRENCFGEVERERAEDDGTYDLVSDTLVCDNCYFYIMQFTPSGKALHHEMEQGIVEARRYYADEKVS